MAKHPLLLLLLAMWALAGALWPGAEAKEEFTEVHLCGLELTRKIIYICGNIHWRRSDSLAQEAMGGALPDTGPYADRQLEEAAGSQALYGSLRSARENPKKGSLLDRCCNVGCPWRELTVFCQ